MDVERWRKIITSKQFGNSSSEFFKDIVRMTRKFCSLEDQHESLEAFVARRLIPLDKPGFTSRRYHRNSRRNSLESCSVYNKTRDITESVGSLQVCVGQEAGSEAAVQAIHEIFKEQYTEAGLFIDATNAYKYSK